MGGKPDPPNAVKHGRSIALYSPGWPPGQVQNGIVTYVGQIAPALSQLGARAHIVTVSQRSPAPNGLSVDLSKLSSPLTRRILLRAIERVPYFRQMGLAFAWKLAQGLARIEANHGLDLIEMEETFGAAWFVQEVMSAPVVVRLHGPWFVNGSALGVPVDAAFRKRERLERLCIASALGVTLLSRDLLDRVRREYGLALSHAAVIPNSAPRVPAERRWSLKTCDRKIVLFVGRFDRHKGGDVMIDAFREFAEVLPNVELIFVGPDRGFRDDMGNTHDIVTYLDRRLTPAIKARVHIRGALPSNQIDELRRQAFVTVMASRYENFSLALLEALSFGCPTVASDAGGNVEILIKDRTGLFFAAGDPSDLAAKVIALFRAPERAAELGRQAAMDMSERLSPESVARATLDYYETVWSSRPRFPRRSAFRRALYELSGLV